MSEMCCVSHRGMMMMRLYLFGRWTTTCLRKYIQFLHTKEVEPQVTQYIKEILTEHCKSLMK